MSETAPGLLEIADELYALTLSEFTPARDARAKELKAGDKELSARVKALKKPSTAAWVVNLLVRGESEQVEQVLTVGAALREAQANLRGDELRALTRQRRQLTAAVTTRARGLAAEVGVKVTSSVSDQVEATLTAAMVDEECAKAIRSGLLVAALAATGVDEVELANAVAVPEALGFAATPRSPEPGAPPDLHVVPDPDAEEKAVREAEKTLADAERELGKADSSLAAAAEGATKLEARGMQLQAEIDELKGKLAELETTFEENDDALGDAEDVRTEAEAALRDAGQARDRAAAALTKLS